MEILLSIARLHGEACIVCGSADHPLFPVDKTYIEGRPVVACKRHKNAPFDEWQEIAVADRDSAVTGVSQAPAVNVVLAAEGGWCQDRGCLMPAQLVIQVKGKRLYCAGCAVPRIGRHRAARETIAYSDGARHLLGLSPSTEPDTPEQMEADFPGWHVWRTRRGDDLVNWAASRHNPAAGVSPTVIRDSSEALRAALVEERAAAAQGPQAKLVITR